MAKFQVGDEVVVFYSSSPLQHNSKNSPKHPCRGKVLKVGRKNYQIQSNDGRLVLPIDQSGMLTIETVEDARIRHSKNFAGPDEWRSAKMIQKILARL